MARRLLDYHLPPASGELQCAARRFKVLHMIRSEKEKSHAYLPR
jgi:hypothetical protein